MTSKNRQIVLSVVIYHRIIPITNNFYKKGRKMENNEAIRDQEIEIDLVALFHELVKHWKAIVASMVLLAAVFGLYSKITFVPEYEASAEMYVLTKSTSITSLADIQVGSSLTNDYEYVITGRTVLSQVIDNLDMDETYEQLKERVSIDNPTDTRVLRIVVTDTDLDDAKTVADEIANVSSAYIADNMDQSQPKIIQTAYASKTPVNNNILKNTVIGAVLGLFLAAGIVVLGYMLDDTISTADDMESRTGLKVLASLPMDQTEYDGKKSSKKRKKKKTGTDTKSSSSKKRAV